MGDLLRGLESALRDRYHVAREVGHGGMAIVYLAEDVKHRRRVAIKVLRPELIATLGTDRFLREIEIAAQLAHPNILPLYDSGQVHRDPERSEGEGPPLLYYVMPYVEGETLRDRLNREKQLPLDEALQIAREVADALAYAHSLGLIHRDIKPENILFQAGHAVVSDFGIARAVSHAARDQGGQLTESGIAVGTLAYMSPEQTAGKRDLDSRTDIYSLGCVLYEMLAGEVPLGPSTGANPTGGPAADVRAARETVSLPLASVIGKALARAPADRFATAAHFTEALGAATRSQTAGPAFRPARRRLWVPIATLASVVALAAALSVGGLWNRIFRPASGAAAGIKLAVLPFDNLTGDSRQEYFTDGLTEEMITELGRVQPRALRVIARTSAMRYKKTEKPIDQIGRELGVDYVLEGSARREGARVRIAVQLIRTRDQIQLWADSYERDLSSVLSAQSAVAQGVAGSLKITLIPSEEARTAAARPVNAEAYEAYLAGKFYSYKLSAPDLDAALHYFQTALAKDPGFARAHSGIAIVWLTREQMGLISPADASPKATAAAMTALRLDNTLTEAHYVLALIHTQERQWQIADSEFQRAIALNPGFPDVRAFYSHLLNFLGRRAEARAQIDQAVDADPLNPLFLALDGVDFLFERRPQKAIEQSLKAVKTAPELSVALNALWIAYEAQGRYAEAAGYAAKYLSAVGQDSARLAVERGYTAGGYREAMRRGAEALVARARTAYVTPSDVAQFAVSSGDHDRVFEWLERGYEARDPNVVYIDLVNFDPVRKDPRLTALRRRLNLPP